MGRPYSDTSQITAKQSTSYFSNFRAAEQSLGKRKISPHQVRHTTALHMLQRGVRLEVIALWLGHEKLDTTHHYLEADLAMKEKALASLHLPKAKNPRFQPPDELLDFLEQL
jgi:site-specific recombinase XerD